MLDKQMDTSREQPREVTTDESRTSYVPGFGHHWLLPLYDPFQKLLGFESYHRSLVEQASILPGHRVLEIGCGTGNLLILMKRLHPNAEVVGLDPDPEALARARRKAGRESLYVGLDHGYAEELPYPDASFDRVLSAFMFHHLELDEKRLALREAWRVLSPGGSLHLLDFGGAMGEAGGLIARMIGQSARFADNIGDRIPTLMREAGFTSPAELVYQDTAIGRFAYFRGDVPSSDGGDVQRVT